MDQTLLNEMLTSLRIIRDEIGKLREDDVAHRIHIDRLDNSFAVLEKQVSALHGQSLVSSGSWATAAKIAAGLLAISSLAIAFAQFAF